MGLFDSVLKDNESLFRDESALDLDVMPPKILSREYEHQYIADCIKPLLQKRTGKNLFITGTPGIGKTVATKSVLSELEQDENIAAIYVNCWKKDSAHKIVLDVCDQLNYKYTISKTTEQLMGEISRILNKKACVIVFDEVDKLSSDAITILYSFTEDIFRKTIILITNDKEFLSKLDRRIYSRLVAETFSFRPYTLEETYGILKDRTQRAFMSSIFNEEGLRKIAEKVFDVEDIRVGLYLLREAGTIAERKLKRKIELEDAEEALSKTPELKLRATDLLSEEQLSLLELIKNNSGKSTKEIHELYDPSLSYKTVFRRLKELESDKFISIAEQNIGAGKQSFVHYVY